MNREPTMRTCERVAFSDARKTTSRASLGCVSRINLSDVALPLYFVADHLVDHTTRPYGEPSVPSLAAVFALYKPEILKYQNTVLRSPFDKLFRSAVAEIFSSTRSLSSQPFEGSDNAPSILTLCLTLSKLSLKSLDRLRRAFVLDFPVQAAYEKLVIICIYCHNSICLIKIDPNRMNSLDIRQLNCIRDVTDELASKMLNYNAIDLSGVIEIFFEGTRNCVSETLPAVDSGNAQESIFCETSIAPSLTYKKESKRSVPVKGVIQSMLVLLSRSVSPCSKLDACTSKLTRYSPFNIVVEFAMQIQSFKRLAKVPSSLRYTITYLGKAIKRLDEGLIMLDNYLQRSFGKHQSGDATMRINTLRLSGGD